MLPKSTSSTRKGAPIKKMGHTTTEQYGHAVNPRQPAKKSARDLNLK